MKTSPLLIVKNLQVNFADKVILDKINFTVQQGQVVTIIGPNGAGKSTLLRVILGLLKPNSGKVNLLAGTKIGYMPQKLMLEAFMPINVTRFLTLNNKIKQDFADFQHIKQILVQLKIMHLLESPLQQISGGELQRVLLARALLNEPQLLVLDEPVQGVDVTGQAELYALINEVCRQRQMGILMVSHDLHIVMASTDEVICLNRHICCSGHPEAVSLHPEFLELFGTSNVAGQLAVYTHHHNHRHEN